MKTSLCSLLLSLSIGCSSVAGAAELINTDSTKVSSDSVNSQSPSVVVSTKTSDADAVGSTASVPVQVEDAISALHGSVSETDVVSPFALANKSIEVDVSKHTKFGIGKGIVVGAKSLGNFVLDLRGFDWSKEGADAILEQAKHEKSDFAKEYLLRKEHDARELAATRTVLQLASVIDRDQVKTDKALDNLKKIVGNDAAQAVQARLRALPVGDELVAERENLIFDIEQKNDKLKSMLSVAASHDEVLRETTRRLEKFNHRSKAMQYTAKVVYTTLGIASFSPTLVAPIAGASLLAFMMATGGPEQDKLLKEIYLGKIMQSRCDVLNEKGHLVNEGIDLALLTNNKRLYACTKELLATMADAKQSSAILGLPESHINSAQVNESATAESKTELKAESKTDEKVEEASKQEDSKSGKLSATQDASTF